MSGSGFVLQEEQEDFKGKERGEEESVSIHAKSTRKNPSFLVIMHFLRFGDRLFHHLMGGNETEPTHFQRRIGMLLRHHLASLSKILAEPLSPEHKELRSLVIFFFLYPYIFYFLLSY